VGYGNSEIFNNKVEAQRIQRIWSSDTDICKLIVYS